MSNNKRIPVKDLEELLKLVKKYLLEDKSLVGRTFYKSSGTISYKNRNSNEGEIIEPMRIGVCLKNQANEEVDIFIPFEGFPSSPEQEKLFEKLKIEAEKLPKIESPKTVVEPSEKFSERRFKVNNSAEFLAKVKELIVNERIEFFKRHFSVEDNYGKEGNKIPLSTSRMFSMGFRSPNGVIKIYSKNNNFEWKDSDEIELGKLLASQTTQSLNESKQNNINKEREIRIHREISDKNLPKSSNKGLVLGAGLGILVGAALMGIIIYSINKKKK